MHESFANFVSETGGHAAQTARNVGQAIASQVGSTASGLANIGAKWPHRQRISSKPSPAKLKGIARKNPLGAIAVGIVIGLIVRGRG